MIIKKEYQFYIPNDICNLANNLKKLIGKKKYYRNIRRNILIYPSSLSRKDLLYKNFKNLSYENYFIKSDYNKKNIIDKDNELVICRKILSCQQRDVFIKNANLLNFNTKDYLYSKLIIPKLFQGYKYHLRGYFLFDFGDCYYYKHFKLLTASEKYNYENPNINQILTGYVSSIYKEHYIPDNEYDENLYLKHIEEIKKILLISKKILILNQQIKGIYLLGVDFMVDINDNLIICEMNGLPQLKNNKYSDDLLKNVVNVLFYRESLNENLVKLEN